MRRRSVLGVSTAAVSLTLVLTGCSSSGDDPAATPPMRAGADAARTTSASWPMYHGDPAHSGYDASLPTVRHARLSHDLKLDGEVYASPIVISGRTIVATENDSVYSLSPSYKRVWKVSLGRPSPSQERECGDITPLGITGTPIYSATTKSIYVVAEQRGKVRHVLYALNPANGKVRWKRVVDLPGVSARDMQQRGALAITHGRVWVSYGAQAGDCGNYKGRVVGVPLDGHGSSIFYSPPTKRGGGIWNPAGPTVGPKGDLFVVSANGAAFPGNTYDHTNSVLRIGARANLVDSFAPRDWATYNQQDLGLGSNGVALVGSKWAVVGGKSNPVWVLDRNHLGGIAGAHSTTSIAPVFGGSAVRGDTVYLPFTDGVRAVRVDSTGHLHVRWHASSSIDGSPVIGGGRVWTLDAGAGVLYGLDPADGKVREKVTVGSTSRFATPAFNGRDVLVPTLSGLAVVHTSS